MTSFFTTSLGGNGAAGDRKTAVLQRAGVAVLAFAMAVLVWALPLATPGMAQSRKPSDKPILTIETVQHSAKIQFSSVDRAGKYLITGSYDRTVRVWTIPREEGEPFRLQRVLRPPIGLDDEGKIYAAAMSPDQKYVAAAGWTGDEWHEDFSVYIFDWLSGRLVKEIVGMPNVINALAFSPDGKQMAVGLGGANGVRVFSTGDWRQQGALTGFGQRIYGLSYADDGRLAVTSYDPLIRVYGRDLKLTAEFTPTRGKRPYRIDFSPDGSEVVVGYADTTDVVVHDSKTLEEVLTLATDDVQKLDLLSVGWSADGKSIFAGGRANIKGTDDNFVRRFDAATGASVIDIPVSRTTIMGIHPLKDGSFVFAAQDPTIGLVDANNQIKADLPSPILNMRNFISQKESGSHQLRVSHDGTSISMPVDAFDPSTPYFRFDLKSRRLDLLDSEDSTLVGPKIAANALTVQDWTGRGWPIVNGKTIPLLQYERSRALAIDPDDSGFIIGADWTLRSYAKTGSKRWEVSSPGVAWRVNTSGDGRFVIAAYGDGTVRWHRASDGAVVLSVFATFDGTRPKWIAWTPQGYFDAAPGAEDLIGWHVNQGIAQESYFYGAGRFRDQFYRPDVIDLVLELMDVDKAVDKANDAAGRTRLAARLIDIAPPVVRVLKAGADNTFNGDETKLLYMLESPSGKPVRRLSIRADGQPLLTIDQGLALGQVRELTIKDLPQRNLNLSVLAESDDGAGEPDVVALKYAGERAEGPPKPALYALVVGVSKYDRSNLKLTYAHQDAMDFAAALQAQVGQQYRSVEVKLLTNENATRANILAGLSWLEQMTEKDDVAALFMAGHGYSPRQTRYFYLPYDADPTNFRATAVDRHDISDTLEAVRGKTFVFLDTCNSGAASTTGEQVNITPFINELSSPETGAVVFSSSTGQQPSLEDDKWHNGAFTEALLEALSGRADLFKDDSGAITVAEIDLYISERVKQLTGGQQQPVMTKPSAVPNFTFLALGI